MRKHFSLNRILVVVMALSLMIFAVAASAQADDSTVVPSFTDGRVNSLDIAAPGDASGSAYQFNWTPGL